jgi:hypothetical protein
MIVAGGGRPARNLTRHEVHRPRPPQVAVTSTPPACAAFRIVVPGATLSVRLDAAPPAARRIVSETALTSHSSGMLAPMEIDVEGMKRMAAAGGFAWTDAELESIRPAVERMLDALGRLESVPLGELEPTTQFRVL